MNPPCPIMPAAAQSITASVVVLAGRRSAIVDPLAAQHGVTDKCLVPLHQRPLIEHVLDALSASPHIDAIYLSTNDPDALSATPMVRTLMTSGRLTLCAARDNIADSVLDAAASATFPLLITTADNALLHGDAIADILTTSAQSGADVTVAFARKADVLAAHPDGQRRFYQFRDDAYSNCNCYWMRDRAMLHAAEAFRSGGQFSKHPMRIARLFGIFNLLRFRMGWCTLDSGLGAIGKRLGLTLRPIIALDGSVAIDVDNERTYRVVETLLHQRQSVARRA